MHRNSAQSSTEPAVTVLIDKLLPLSITVTPTSLVTGRLSLSDTLQ